MTPATQTITYASSSPYSSQISQHPLPMSPINSGESKPPPLSNNANMQQYLPKILNLQHQIRQLKQGIQTPETNSQLAMLNQQYQMILKQFEASKQFKSTGPYSEQNSNKQVQSQQIMPQTSPAQMHNAPQLSQPPIKTQQPPLQLQQEKSPLVQQQPTQPLQSPQLPQQLPSIPQQQQQQQHNQRQTMHDLSQQQNQLPRYQQAMQMPLLQGVELKQPQQLPLLPGTDLSKQQQQQQLPPTQQTMPTPLQPQRQQPNLNNSFKSEPPLLSEVKPTSLENITGSTILDDIGDGINIPDLDSFGKDSFLNDDTKTSSLFSAAIFGGPDLLFGGDPLDSVTAGLKPDDSKESENTITPLQPFKDDDSKSFQELSSTTTVLSSGDQKTGFHTNLSNNDNIFSMQQNSSEQMFQTMATPKQQNSFLPFPFNQNQFSNQPGSNAQIPSNILMSMSDFLSKSIPSSTNSNTVRHTLPGKPGIPMLPGMPTTTEPTKQKSKSKARSGKGSGKANGKGKAGRLVFSFL